MGPKPPRWRSLLFMPAHVERFIARAHERGADGMILDLEDAVPPRKRTPRGPAGRLGQRRHEGGGAAMVRVNHGLLALARDLEAAVPRA